MKLSDAILAGAQMRPSCSKAFFGEKADGTLGSGPLGAAAEATGFEPTSNGPIPCYIGDVPYDRASAHLCSAFPELLRPAPSGLVGELASDRSWPTLFVQLARAFARMLWSREEIAARLQACGL